MKAVKTLDVLRKARKLISNSRNWIIGSFHDSANKRHCAVGAVCEQLNCYGPIEASRIPNAPQLFKALDTLAQRRYGLDLAGVNDKKGRKAAISVIDDAIEELENNA